MPIYELSNIPLDLLLVGLAVGTFGIIFRTIAESIKINHRKNESSTKNFSHHQFCFEFLDQIIHDLISDPRFTRGCIAMIGKTLFVAGTLLIICSAIIAVVNIF